MNVLGISGSLRQKSWNTGLLRAAVGMVPEGMNIEMFDISAIPMYNADNDGAVMPAAVKEFKSRITSSDALLLATPEYNYSIPGVLKNMIDWASRTPKRFTAHRKAHRHDGGRRCHGHSSRPIASASDPSA